jgi:aspartate/methionine/tyrosine aminotransferase
MSFGERLVGFGNRRERSGHGGRDAFDPIKWKWDVGMLAGEMGLPTTLREILPKTKTPDGFIGPSGISLDTQLGWTGQRGGTYHDLKERIIQNCRYEVGTENLMLSHGTQGANFAITMASVKRGDEVIIPRPSWFQWEPLCYAIGAKIKMLPLIEENGWRWDLEELKETVTSDTRMIFVCNPNNPTGRIYDEKEMKAIIEIAQEFDAVLLVDEEYRGLELDKPLMSTPAACNLYYNAYSTQSMSKIFTADGLRVGWAASRNKEGLAKAQRVKSIAAGGVGGLQVILSWAAHDPGVMEKIVGEHRQDAIAKREVLSEWMRKQSFFSSWVKPEAAFLSFPGWTSDINSVDFVNKAWDFKRIDFDPGTIYGVEKHCRFGTGRITLENLKTSLAIVDEFLESLE